MCLILGLIKNRRYCEYVLTTILFLRAPLPHPLQAAKSKMMVRLMISKSKMMVRLMI
jgi:hypothetical protein